jgi:hypothetical protein
MIFYANFQCRYIDPFTYTQYIPGYRTYTKNCGYPMLQLENKLKASDWKAVVCLVM